LNLVDCPLGEQQENTDMDPYTTFVYGIRSPYTKDSYCRRLRGFFDAINLGKGNTLRERCNIFVHKGRADPNWAFNNIIRFLHYQKERVGKKEITAGTLHNYVKTLKMFCEITDIAIPWKKITRGLPRGRRYADDRSPTIEEIHKIIEYPDRRIKPLVYTMSSSGIRVGAWDYLKWGHVSPIIKEECKLLAARVNVYAGEDDEYFTFITPEAYLSLESWMRYRSRCGEHITKDSWVMRDLWNSVNKLPQKEENARAFADRGRSDPVYAFNSVLRFFQSKREQIDRKEMAIGTVRNYVKSIKLFCDMADLQIPWAKITRGLPRAKRFADDRAPTLQEIRKIAEYPDRRIKPVICTMVSTGIRVGANGSSIP
jgi:hypothetical protein